MDFGATGLGSPDLNLSFIYVERGGMALDVAVALAVNVAVAVLIVCGNGCLLIVGWDGQNTPNFACLHTYKRTEQHTFWHAVFVSLTNLRF